MNLAKTSVWLVQRTWNMKYLSNILLDMLQKFNHEISNMKYEMFIEYGA